MQFRNPPKVNVNLFPIYNVIGFNKSWPLM